jgi:hypothetical protein
MANVNTTPKVFENGGVFTINEGGAQVVMNIEAGTIVWRPGKRQVKNYRDRGVIQTPLMGSDDQTELEFTVKATTYVANDLYAILMTAGSAGTVNLYDTIVIRLPAYRGASTGEDITFTNCWVTERPEIRFGGDGPEDFDTVSWKMACAAAPASVAY